MARALLTLLCMARALLSLCVAFAFYCCALMVVVYGFDFCHLRGKFVKCCRKHQLHFHQQPNSGAGGRGTVWGKSRIIIDIWRRWERFSCGA